MDEDKTLQVKIDDLQNKLGEALKTNSDLREKLKKYREQAFAAGLLALAKEHECDITTTQAQIIVKGNL